MSDVNCVTLDFWTAMTSCFPSAQLTREKQSWFALASASAMLETEAINNMSSAYDFMSRSEMGQYNTKCMVKGSCRDDGSQWDPLATGEKASGAAANGTRSSAMEVCHKLTKKIVSESGVVNHLDEEVVTLVRDHIKYLQDVHRYGYCFASGLKLV